MMHNVYQRIFDPATQAYFYHNVKTGETSWMTPRGLKIKPKTSPNGGLDDDEPSSLPPGWREAFDEATQHIYYVNESTKETSWTIPQGGAWKPFVLDEDEAATLLQAAWRGRRGRDRVRAVLADTIEAIADPVTGATTYFNKKTNISSAHAPRLPLTPSERPHLRNRLHEFEEVETPRRLFSIGKRNYPRSKAQLIVDAAEDLELENTPALELDMSNLQALKVTGRVWNLDNLERLILKDNRLTRIPSGIQDLTRLVHLDLSHNALATLPSGLQTTKSLTYLDASHNSITTFSPRLWKLKGLIHLDLSHNLLRELPYVEGDLKLLKETGAWGIGIGLLTKLQTLGLSHNQLAAWPTLLESCMALTALDLSHNGISDLGPDLGNLLALDSLHVHHNALSGLPPNFGLLSNLRICLASHNSIVYVPESISDCEKLEVLDLTNNKLTTLPEATKALKTLTQLLLSENPLACYPNHMTDMHKLSDLALASCGMETLPASIWTFSTKQPALSTVDLSHNEFQSLPTAGIPRLRPVLTSIQLSHNALDILEPLLCTCHRLLFLDVSHNALSGLPTEISGLKALEKLVLSYNQLRSVPDSITTLVKLKALHLDHNALATLPQDIGRLAALEYLNISHNMLAFLPSTCHELRRLTYLSAAFNKLEVRPPYLQQRDSMCVDLSNNPFATLEADYHAFLGAVHKAKRDLEHGAYTAAHALFTELLYDAKLRPFAVLHPTHRHIRSMAVCYRGICRYNQISAALRELDGLKDEVATLTRIVHEDAMLRNYIAHRPFSATKGPAVPLKPDDEIAAACARLEALVARKVELRSNVALWRDDAVGDLRAALRLRVEPATTSYTLAMLYSKLQEFPAAVQAWTEAMGSLQTSSVAEDDDETVTSSLVPLLMERARAFAGMGQIPRALMDYRRILAVFPLHAEAQWELNAWSDHHKAFHEPCGVDNEELLRAYAVDVATGIGRRVHDPAVEALATLNEIDSKTEFAAECQRLRDAEALAQVQTALAHKAQKAVRDAAVATTVNRQREIRANLTMQAEEDDQRKRDAAIAHALHLHQLELVREANERAWMEYEEELQRWVEGEQARLRQEELDALEAARRKAEEKAEYKKRLARRGGLRQSASTRGRKKSLK
ncbi:hypothetical protein ACHHYP_09665 [Achlya hypogyna]|uniref:WW domain-containing protein n=1 Tax=Achlya hypogyna TaxID=1202772 RepID=A0A1V9YMR4_ACHHY|nr:hypothetical protein ACHHYP_09665 [Achlya hypogyna]